MSIVSAYMVPHPPIAVPEIGKGEEKKIQPTLDSYDEVAEHIAKMAPDTIIITSPHSVMYGDYFHISPGAAASGSFAGFRAPQVGFTVDYDEELRDEICNVCAGADFPAGKEYERDPELDHGTMVPLYFIAKRYTDFKLIRIGLSGMSLKDHWRFGQYIAQAVKNTGRRVAFVGSGDLSHCQKEDGPYGYKPSGPQYDEWIMDVMSRGAFLELLDFEEWFLRDAQECGHRSFCIMAGALSDRQVRTTPLSHEATFGVGYGFAIYE